MNRIRIRTLNSVVFLFLIFSVGLISVKGITLPETGVRRFLSGKTFRKMEDHYQESFPEKNWLIGMWAALQYSLFKEGRPGVVVGQKDWLFSAEEYRFPQDHMKTWSENLTRIIEADRFLKTEHKTLIIALVPEKVDIYRQNLDRSSPHNDFELYEKTYQKIQQAGIPVIDLKQPLRKAKEEGTQVFFRTDTHWTEEGAQVAAKTIAGSGLIEKGDEHFTFHSLGKDTHTGDLLNYIPTGEAFAKFSPPLEKIQKVDFEKQGGASEDLFADVELRTALIGTSYSADERWHFQEWLQYYLQQEIVKYAEKGHGPFTPMKKFIATERKNPGDATCIIWEIPTRYLLINPEQEETKL